MLIEYPLMEKASKYPSVENLLHLRNIALEFVK